MRAAAARQFTGKPPYSASGRRHDRCGGLNIFHCGVEATSVWQRTPTSI
jgi:hypothetical protein